MSKLQNTVIGLVTFFQIAAAGGRAFAECFQFIDVKETADHLLTIDPKTVNPEFVVSLTDKNREGIVKALEDKFEGENKDVKRSFERLFDYALDIVEAEMKGSAKKAERAKNKYGKQTENIRQEHPVYEHLLGQLQESEKITLQDLNEQIDEITRERPEERVYPLTNIPEGAVPVCINTPAP
jgi:hypothetical protein